MEMIGVFGSPEYLETARVNKFLHARMDLLIVREIWTTCQSFYAEGEGNDDFLAVRKKSRRRTFFLGVKA